MTPVSREFAPPLELVAPFFKVGAVFYFLSMLSLLFLDVGFTYQQFSIAGWLHLFLLGYVMMIIFGAMAQLIPVVLETGHAAVDLYYAILPMLSAGIVVMVAGFWFAPSILSYGGVLVLSAMVIFAAESVATLRKSKLKNLTVSTVLWGNGFLFAGILAGFVIALGFSGVWQIDVSLIVKSHVFMLLGGYIFVTIMGLSLVLLPMFSLSHGFDQKPVHRAFWLVVWGVCIVFAGSVAGLDRMMGIGYLTTMAGGLFYIWQVYIIGRRIVRKERDIWFKSIVSAFGFLIAAIAVTAVYFATGKEALLHTAVWFYLAGFVSFMILGHLYKIVPFLVWFERFSPLVGKEKVPMLHEMYPKEGASMLFGFTLVGVLIVGMGLLFESSSAFKAGASFLAAGAFFLVVTMYQMLSYGTKK